LLKTNLTAKGLIAHPVILFIHVIGIDGQEEQDGDE
jgi:hypothetical protein